jgi:hypothetical protein
MITKHPDYDYSELIKRAETDVKNYEEKLIEYENKLFNSRLALEQLRIRQDAQ